MPGYARRRRRFPDPADYLTAVLQKAVSDQVINFQLTHGFQPEGILKGYHPEDRESGGNAVLMFWPNPLAPEERGGKTASLVDRLPASVRVATVQFMMRRITRIEEFEEQVEYWVDVAADYHSDFVVFPELFTLELLSISTEKLPPEKAIDEVADYTDRYVEFMEKLAVSYNINIIGGSHPTRMKNGEIRNIAYVFLRDGSVHTQQKLHPTPSERALVEHQGRLRRRCDRHRLRPDRGDDLL